MAAPAPSNAAKAGTQEAGQRPRIFVIGLNKCGTTSFHRLFSGSGMVSSHWTYKGRHLAVAMVNNMSLGRHPLAGFDEVEAFTDLTFIEPDTLFIEAARFFREIHAFEPDAYFILNTRDVDAWLTSRGNHGGLMKNVRRMNRISQQAVLDGWRAVFDLHHRQVRDYFADNPRFLEFNIETDDIARVVDFLAPHYTIDASHWGRHFATEDRENRPRIAARARPSSGMPEGDTALNSGARAFLQRVNALDIKPNALKQVRRLIRGNPTLFNSSTVPD